jgi:Ca2+-binding RTX toxin-like protein
MVYFDSSPNFDKSMALVSVLPKMTYDLPALVLPLLGDESKYTIDYLGDKNDNILTGTTKDEIFVAGAGNDTLTGNGGMDVHWC